MLTQNDLVATYVSWPVGNKERSLLEMCKQFERGKIILPNFQREFIWSIDKIKGWIQTIIDKQAIGVIVTYQLEGGSPIYLADGYQRITATLRFLSNPQDYKFNFGQSQAELYVDGFDITVQHRIYKDHRDAMRSFQRINSGTTLTTGEFYKGELTLTETGNKLYTCIPDVISKYETMFIRPTRSRNISNKLSRDAFALYYQYITGYKYKSFWDVASSKVNGVQVIEKILYDYSIDKGIAEIANDLKKFETFIANHYADLDKKLIDSRLKGRALSYTTNRYFVHFHIWCNNNNISYSSYSKMIDNILSSLEKYDVASNTIDYEDHGKVLQFRFKINGLENIEGLARYFDIREIISGSEKRKKNIYGSPGWDEHHPEVFSKNGNGNTVVVPALLNRSWGDNPPHE